MIDETDAGILEMERLLRNAASAFTYPETPTISAVVGDRIRQASPERSWRIVEALRVGWSRPLARAAIVAISVVALVVGAALAVPQSRSALADFFGLSHVRVDVGPIAEPTPPALSPISFARPATLEEAREVADFAVRLPTINGAALNPDAVYLQGEVAVVTIFVYDDEGYDLYESRGAFFGKGVTAPFDGIEFDGHDALWISEGGHVASFLDEDGQVMVESRRTVDRATLFWEENGVTYRLETSLSQEEAIRVAQSLR